MVEAMSVCDQTTHGSRFASSAATAAPAAGEAVDSSCGVRTSKTIYTTFRICLISILARGSPLRCLIR